MAWLSCSCMFGCLVWLYGVAVRCGRLLWLNGVVVWCGCKMKLLV